MNPSALLGTWVASGGLGITAANVSGAQGFDFMGMAALVTAVSGLIATVGAIYLGSRKKSNDTAEQALKLLLEIQQKASKKDEGE